MGEGLLLVQEEWWGCLSNLFPSLGSRLPLIVTLSPKLGISHSRTPIPSKIKSLKHKNGKWGGTMGVILTMSSGTCCWRVEVEGQRMGRAAQSFYHPTSSLVIFRVLCLYLCIKHPSLLSSSGELSRPDPCFKVVGLSLRRFPLSICLVVSRWAWTSRGQR